MRNQWLDEELKKIETSENQFLLSEVRKYIEQLEDDNESLQISLEGSIWSPNRWNEGTKK